MAADESKHNFPVDHYTPHGYVDNPAHCRVLNMSGVIRSCPAIGMGWWYPTGRFDDDDDAGTEYISLLQLSFNTGGTPLATSEDFEKAGVSLTSQYHTKNLKSFDFEVDGLMVSAGYVLVHEHLLACRVEIKNNSGSDRSLDLYASNIFKTVVRRWWGADGLAGNYLPDEDAIVQTGWAYGDVFALKAESESVSHDFAFSEDEWAGKCAGELANTPGGSVRRRDPIYGMLHYSLSVPANGTAGMKLGLARGVNRAWTLNTLREGFDGIDDAFAARVADDDHFYSSCPLLTGDWPNYWRRSWIYDWETQRMNSRPPVGIYKHHWDAMQVHEPRVVLGETAIDTMMLSYADADLALEQLYGVFADAPSPQVPCSREDGSMNMIAADGSECGTAPSWCFPFHVIHSVYCRYPDDEWLGKLYPYLVAFLDWWFENRTDDDGWFHCKCSWESGQDGSKRFLIDSHNPGGVAEFVRTVDVEASVAEALANMAVYAGILGKHEDEKRWRELAEYRAKHTREMYLDGWYRDFDSRTNEPIILEDYYDIMMLAPITCHVATQEQIEAIAPMFQYFVDNSHFWLEWPSFVFPFTDAAWNAGQHQLIADALHTVADRVYRKLDAREVTYWERDKMLYRVPGVSYEFWAEEDRQKTPGGGTENYGWGAAMPTNIIRGIFGFHESVDPARSRFIISPTIPTPLQAAGKTYGVTNLRYRGVTFDLDCTVEADGSTSTVLRFRSDAEVSLTAVSDDGGKTSASGKSGTLKLSGPSGSRFTVEVS